MIDFGLSFFSLRNRIFLPKLILVFVHDKDVIAWIIVKDTNEKHVRVFAF